MITRQGRVEVLNDEDCREFPWHPKPVLELSDSNAVQLNEGPCLVLFVGMKPQQEPQGGLDKTDLTWGVSILQLLSILNNANNAEPGPLSLPAALLLTPMIYSWLCPCRRGFESCRCAFLPRLPAGKNRSGWSPAPLQQTHCWEEAGLRAQQLQGLGPLGPRPPTPASGPCLCVPPSVSSLLSG